MVSATMKEKENLVTAEIPQAQNITKPEMKILLKTLMVGQPKEVSLGSSPLISDGKKIIKLENLKHWAAEKKGELPNYYQDQMIVLIKADENVKMGLIGDIQEKLREANTRKVIYRTLEEVD